MNEGSIISSLIRKTVEGQVPGPRNFLTRKLAETIENQEEEFRVYEKSFVDFQRLKKYEQELFEFTIPEDDDSSNEMLPIREDKVAVVSSVEPYIQKGKDGNAFYPAVRFEVEVGSERIPAYFLPYESDYTNDPHKKTRRYSSVAEARSAPLESDAFVYFSEDMLQNQITKQLRTIHNSELAKSMREERGRGY